MSAPEDQGGAETVVARRLSASERAPLWSLRLHARERSAHSLVIVPTLYLLAAVVLGVAIPALDRSGVGSDLLGVTPGEAQSILESIAAGMVAFSGLVVSVAVLVVQFGAGQYSPRLVPSFRSDAVIKNALGLFVAPGVYALVAVANLGGSTTDRVGTTTVLVALALMIAALVALFRFIGRLLDLMRPRRIFARLLDAFALAVDDVYPPSSAAGIEVRSVSTAPVSATLRHRHRNELLIGVDRARLVRAARAAGALIEVTAPIGSHVGDDAPILFVRGGSHGRSDGAPRRVDVRRRPAHPGGPGVRDPLHGRRRDPGAVARGQRPDERGRGPRCARGDVVAPRPLSAPELGHRGRRRSGPAAAAVARLGRAGRPRA